MLPDEKLINLKKLYARPEKNQSEGDPNYLSVDIEVRSYARKIYVNTLSL